MVETARVDRAKAVCKTRQGCLQARAMLVQLAEEVKPLMKIYNLELPVLLELEPTAPTPDVSSQGLSSQGRAPG